MNTIGRVVSYEHLGALDGPGLRTVVFLAGCPLRCKYCHNADMLNVQAGRETTVDEVIGEVERYRDYCTGGVTLSGGEPLLQTAFTAALLDALKKKGIHTALDTAGSVFAPDVLEKADLVILDIKHTDPQGFTDLTGGKLETTLQTLDYLRAHGKRFWVRQVIVEGITDGAEQLRKLKALSLGAEKLELLPYHTMGAHKWKAIGIEPPLQGVPPLSQEKLQACNKIIENNL